jgi:hypothetical protein
LPPLREWWREINRQERQKQADIRATRKARDKKRAKCRCDAYKFPHRPGGGLCRYPDPPAVRWQDAQAAEIAARVAEFRRMAGEPTPEVMADLIALTTKPCRRYRKRYAGLLRQIARANGLHPIRDRKAIEAIVPRALSLARQLHRQHPKYKYRNMEITERGVTGYWTTAGPTM